MPASAEASTLSAAGESGTDERILTGNAHPPRALLQRHSVLKWANDEPADSRTPERWEGCGSARARNGRGLPQDAV
jgi:hypothetical protein